MEYIILNTLYKLVFFEFSFESINCFRKIEKDEHCVEVETFSAVDVVREET